MLLKGKHSVSVDRGNICGIRRLKLNQVGCDMCGHDLPQLIHEENNIRMTRRDGQRCVDVKVSVCPRCGLVFLSPRMTSQELDTFYLNQLRRYPSVESENLGAAGRIEHAKYLLDRPEFVPMQPRRIMDVGSFDGLFLSYFQSAGWDVIGVEPDQAAAEFARNTYGQHTISSNFESVQPEAVGLFDLITMSHVLEHIESPREFLSKVRSLLKPSAYLFIEVPNLSKPFVSPFYSFFSFQHLFYFTPNSLASLLKASGFSVSELTEPPYAVIKVFARHDRMPESVSHDHQVEYEHAKTHIEDWKGERRVETDRLLRNLKGVLNTASDNNKRVAIYGAGYHTQSLSTLLGGWPECVVVLADDQPEKIGHLEHGLPIVPISGLVDMKIDTVIISSYTYQEMMAQRLRSMDSSK